MTERDEIARHLDICSADPASPVSECPVCHDQPPTSAALRGEGMEKIGDLTEGKIRSDGERCCGGGDHEIAAGERMYWPQMLSQYDDSDPLCRKHAIERARHRGYITRKEAASLRAALPAGEGGQ